MEEDQDKSYNIVIPCSKHPKKAIEYICTHSEPHDQRIYCTTCIFRKEHCNHDEDIKDLNDFLEEQRQQFQLFGLFAKPEIAETLEAKDDFIFNFKEQAQEQLELLETCFDALQAQIANTINRVKENAVQKLKSYIQAFNVVYQNLELKVKLNFREKFFLSKFKNFEDLIQNFLPFSAESVEMMLTCLLENYSDQHRIPTDIQNLYQQIMTIQKSKLTFRNDNFTKYKEKLNALIEEFRTVSSELITSNVLDADNVLNSYFTTKSTEDSQIFSRASSPPKITKYLGLPTKVLSFSASKPMISYPYTDRILDKDSEKSRSRSSSRKVSTRLPAISHPILPVKPDVSKSSEKNFPINPMNQSITINKLAEIETGHLKTIFAILKISSEFIATASDDGTVKIWNLKGQRCVATLKGHKAGVRSLTLLRNSNLVSASWDRTIKIWDSNRLFQARYSPTKLQEGRDEKSDNENQYQCEMNMPCIKTLTGHVNSVLCVGTLSDGKTIISGSTDYTVRLWNSETGEILKVMSGHSDEVLCILAFRSSPLIASGAGDKNIKVWDYDRRQTRPCVKTLVGHSGVVWTLALLLDDVTLVSGSLDKTIKVWNALAGECIKTLLDHPGQILSVRMISEEMLVSGDSEGVVKIWNPKRLTVVTTFKSQDKQAINGIEMVEKILLYAGSDKKINICLAA